jgi:hypothetical protein
MPRLVLRLLDQSDTVPRAWDVGRGNRNVMQSYQPVPGVRNWLHHVYTKRECIRQTSHLFLRHVRNQPSPQLVPVINRTFDFLHSLVDPSSTEPDSNLRPLIRQFLASTTVPTFSDVSLQQAEDTPDTSYVPAVDVQAIEAIGEEEERVDQNEARDDVDELLMHMSLADDGQVSRVVPNS